MKKMIVFSILALFFFTSCRTYYAGYGKGQASHRKCGQRNANSRLFGDVAQPDTCKIFFAEP